MLNVYDFNCREASRRFIEIRTQAGMTQEQLAEKLGVSLQTIKNYEKAGSGNVRDTANETRASAIAGMKIETLFRMAKLFNISADYLMCISDITSSDYDIQKVHEFTGLSQEAIESIVRYKNDCLIPKSLDILNWILSNNDEMLSIVVCLYGLIEDARRLRSADEFNNQLNRITDAELDEKFKGLSDDDKSEIINEMCGATKKYFEEKDKYELSLFKLHKAFGELLDNYIDSFCLNPGKVPASWGTNEMPSIRKEEME